MKTLLLCLLLAQDADDRVTRLLEQLKSDAPAEREAATRGLTKIGPSAVPRLREAIKGDDLEFRGRVKEILKAIDLALKVQEIDRPIPTVTADLKDAPLAEIARVIEQQTGTRIDLGAVPDGHRFPFRVQKASVLQALDTLCAESDLLTYQWPGDEGVKLAVGAWPPYPAAYAEGYRLRIKSLQVNRTQNFEAQQATLQLALEPDHDRSLRPLRNGDVKVEEAVDDQGKKLEPADRKNAAALHLMQRPGGQTGARTFAFSSLSPQATRLSLLRVTATYTYPTETREVILDAPTRGATQNLGRYKVAVTNVTTDSVAGSTVIYLSFAPIVGTLEELRQEIETRFATASVILVDDAGVEHPASLTPTQRFHFEPKVEREVDYVFTVAKKLQRSERKALKLQFHKETHQKTVTFEFKDLRLP
jgi:hypothetical protein